MGYTTLMHAFLIVGTPDLQAKEIDKLRKSLNCKILEFNIEKIEDIRNLNKFVSLTIGEPTAVVIKNISDVTTEGLNAFLKNLEEPQENLYYFLTTSNLHKVLPTIVSRCQIINLKGSYRIEVNKDAESFLTMKTGERLAEIEKIKDRGEAIAFIDGVIYFLQSKLLEKDIDYKKIASQIEAAQKARVGLLSNGNVGLQLTNFVVNLDS